MCAEAANAEYGLRPGAEEFPLMVVLSMIYPCNFGCPNCPYTDANSEIRRFYRERDGDLFKESLWNRIAVECGRYDAWMRCTGGGEPMLHPRMVEMIEFAKQQEDAGLPRAEAILTAAYQGYAPTWGKQDDPMNVMGPVISARQRDRVMGYIQSGIDQGARLIAGGGLAKRGRLGRGHAARQVHQGLSREVELGRHLNFVGLADAQPALHVVERRVDGQSGRREHDGPEAVEQGVAHQA